jgi:hypothetical protein
MVRSKLDDAYIAWDSIGPTAANSNELRKNKIAALCFNRYFHF